MKFYKHDQMFPTYVFLEIGSQCPELCALEGGGPESPSYQSDFHGSQQKSDVFIIYIQTGKDCLLQLLLNS